MRAVFKFTIKFWPYCLGGFVLGWGTTALSQREWTRTPLTWAFLSAFLLGSVVGAIAILQITERTVRDLIETHKRALGAYGTALAAIEALIRIAHTAAQEEEDE